ncbi:MAG: alpha/beta hydrolase family protein [Candidatus Babeliales bacterium]
MRRLYSALLLLASLKDGIEAIPSPACFSLYKHARKQDEIIYLFAHGLRSSQNQGLTLFSNHYNKHSWIIQQPFMLFDFPDAHEKKGYCRDEHVNLGQEEDIERMKLAYEYAIKKLPQSEGFVLTGISRGAATCINFVAMHQPERVKAVVIESPFDTIKSVVNHLLNRFNLSWMPYSSDIGMMLIDTKFERLDTQGIFPVDLIAHIPGHVPILIVGSHSDDVVPIASVRKLYTALKRTGHAHVYLLELSAGRHGRLIKGEQGPLYAACVHAFYERYGLPHVPELVEYGREILAQCQPEVVGFW